MVPVTFIVLFAFSIGYLILGIYVLCKNWFSLINRMFFSLCLQISLWSSGYGFMVIAENAYNANICRLIACFGWCFFYCVWVDFAVLVRCENKKWMTDFRRLLLYLSAAFFFYLNIKGNPYEIMKKVNGMWTDNYPQDFFGFLFTLYSILCAVFGVYIIYRWGQKSSSKREKRQSAIIVISSSIAFFLGGVMDIILPLINIKFFSFDIIVFSIVLPSIWYAVTKYKMMYITLELANEYILKTMNEPVILLGQDLTVKGTNPAAIEKTGYRAFDLLGMPIGSLIQDINKKPVSLNTFFIKNISNYEINLVKKNKECVPCLLSGTQIIDGFNDVIGIACIFYDITDRKRAENFLLNNQTELEKMVYERTSELQYINTLLEEEIAERQKIQESLKASEEHYRALISQYQDGILVFDSQCKLITHNAKSSEILNIKDNELFNYTFETLLESGRYPIKEELLKVIKSRNGLKSTIHIIKKNLSALDLEYIIVPVSFNNQMNVMITFRDITEKLKLEEHTRQMANMESLGTLAGGIAHDFNNILAGIIGYTQLAIDEIDNGNASIESLKNILNLGDRARKLIKQILSFSSKNRYMSENVDVVQVIQEVVTMLNATKPSNVRIDFQLCCEAPVISGDSTELQQMVMNLCVNAIISMREKGGNLDIYAERKTFNNEANANGQILDGEFIKISVRDTGFGIDPVFLNRIFEPFFTTHTGQGGSGMGLAVVHGIIQRYGGWIEVASEPGKGSNFSVFLPSVSKGEITVEKVSENTLSFHNIHILLVDDETAILHSVKRILENNGYIVTGTSSSIEALEIIQKDSQSFDLVITDQSMPEMTGNELIHKILELRSNMPIILCSGYIVEDRFYSENENIEILLKPATKKDYITAIEKVLVRTNVPA